MTSSIFLVGSCYHVQCVCSKRLFGLLGEEEVDAEREGQSIRDGVDIGFELLQAASVGNETGEGGSQCMGQQDGEDEFPLVDLFRSSTK